MVSGWRITAGIVWIPNTLLSMKLSYQEQAPGWHHLINSREAAREQESAQ